MLTEICRYLRNWFDEGMPKWDCRITIQGGQISADGFALQEGQFFRIIGSVFNDGVHQYSAHGRMDLKNEDPFNGTIWAMAVPAEVLALSEAIDTWIEKNGAPESAAMSPYNSESFAGYSYSKSTGATESGGGLTGWQSAYKSQLEPYRKGLPYGRRRRLTAIEGSSIPAVSRSEVNRIVADAMQAAVAQSGADTDRKIEAAMENAIVSDKE